ncbi:hypothetical protein MLD38_038867 [Melastoma candidum]|uniref:Uncharacterized protein n=1 Tax=Melastoma candidum TaxID=119954 RepID=A0ACB9L0Y6_9MYRT|nr:hypothetical protein MLD38_038867 [Melastoma candidum]
MEVSVVGNSQAKAGLATSRAVLFRPRIGDSSTFSSKSRVFTGQSQGSKRGKGGRRLSSTPVRVEEVLRRSLLSPSDVESFRQPDKVRLWVGLPVDSVTDGKCVNHARAIVAGLKALKLLGIDGVEIPAWWGVVEKEGRGKYEWSGYLALAEMVCEAGLELHVTLCFHGYRKQQQPVIPLPDWVMRVGEDDSSSIFFTDRSGRQYKDCLSLAVDELPVLDGRTPMEVYRDFCESFKSSFSAYIGSSIMGVSMGLGPDGELRYPSLQGCESSQVERVGAGEFQCYDRNMLKLLKEAAEACGNPLWGLGGPHDASGYDKSPSSNRFFKDKGGSWESLYGEFFLTWYSNQLIRHGDRLLSLASSIFGDSGVTVSGKIPLAYSWNEIDSHPLELTAGYYSTVNRDGYEEMAKMFAKNSCMVMLPGMDIRDDSARQLLGQIRAACRKHQVRVSGENSLLEGDIEQVKDVCTADDIDSFFYQRMGACFFSPEHFPQFTAFVGSTKRPRPHPDDIPKEEEERAEESLALTSDSILQMQTA